LWCWRIAQPGCRGGGFIPLAETRLRKLARDRGHGAVEGDAAQASAAELETRERGMLKADTGAQAHALLQENCTAWARPTGSISAAWKTRASGVGTDYGEAIVFVAILVPDRAVGKSLAQLANEPELLGTNQIQITATDKNKISRCVWVSRSGGEKDRPGTEGGPGF